MNKPFTLLVKETEQAVVEAINKSQLPTYVLKIMLQNLYSQLETLDNEEIANYEKSQTNDIIKEKENVKKESDK